jgi:hypothetical protein
MATSADEVWVLLVGEGNFSGALALSEAVSESARPVRLVATSFDSRRSL